MGHDMPKPCYFPSPDSCQKRFQWAHKEVDLAPPGVVGLVLQEGGVEKFPLALGLESRMIFSESHSHRGEWR